MKEEVKKKALDYKKQLEEAAGSYQFQILMEEFKEKALQDEIAVWFLFKEIIKEAMEKPGIFDTNPSGIIGTFYILNDMDNEKSYSLFRWFIQNITEAVPSGVIELVTSLITSFSLLEFREFYGYAVSANQAQSAVGYLTLFNLLLEDRLNQEQATAIYELSRTYENTRYHLGNAKDMIEEKYKELYDAGSSSMDLELK